MISILSDLHVDANTLPVPPLDFLSEVTAIVIAGDIADNFRKNGVPFLVDHVLPHRRPVVYVPGNHCFWQTNLVTEIGRMRKVAADLGIHLLAEGESVVIEGVRFVGATLWTDYRVHPDYSLPVAATACRTVMNDHKRIRHNGRLTPKHLGDTHQTHRMAIRRVLEAPHGGKTVVVTHHAPHPRSLLEGAPSDITDGAYASDLTSLITETAPWLWVHGHIHSSRYYRVGETRIIANPRGRSWVARKTFTDPLARGHVMVENPKFEWSCLAT